MRAALLLLLAAFALAGCYVSKTLLLDPKQAVQPLAVGTFSDPKEKGVAMDISLAPDGWYRFYEIGDNTVGRMMFTPLPGQERILAMAYAEKKDGYLYGLAYKGDDGMVYVGATSCSNDAAKRAAMAHHAVISTDSSPSCEFKTRADLLGALADYAKDWNWREDSTVLPAGGTASGS
jgi:hypothetical protein